MTTAYIPHPLELHEAYAYVELHVTDHGELPKLFGKAIKDAGGKYTECRGHQTRRYVDIPTTHTDLIDAVCRRFALDTVILRNERELLTDLRGVPNNRFGRKADDIVLNRFRAHRDNAVAALLARVRAIATPDAWERAEQLRQEREEIARRNAEHAAKLRQEALVAKAAPELLALLQEALKWADQDCPAACMNAVQRARPLLESLAAQKGEASGFAHAFALAA